MKIRTHIFRNSNQVGTIVAILSIVLFFSCTKDIGKLPKIIAATGTPKTISGCGDLTNVSYSAQVQPIINSNCVSCHDASSSFKLYNYVNLLMFANSGQLVGSITGNASYQQMPTTGTLDSCSIKTIVNWVQQGKLNN